MPWRVAAAVAAAHRFHQLILGVWHYPLDASFGQHDGLRVAFPNELLGAVKASGAPATHVVLVAPEVGNLGFHTGYLTSVFCGLRKLASTYVQSI